MRSSDAGNSVRSTYRVFILTFIIIIIIIIIIIGTNYV